MTTLIRSRSVSIHVAAGLTLFFAISSLRAQFIYEQLQSFGLSADSGGHPMSAPIEGLDGRLYGSTPLGGIANLGSLYRADRNGSELRFIHSFAGPEGASPSARLAQDATGRLFGTTQGGGSSDQGVVYSVLPDGSGFRVLKSFDASDPAARKPSGGCILARDGFLYGTTYEGGLHGGGTVFKLGTEGQGFSVLLDFGRLSADGLQPRGELIEGTDGMLYGTTEKGGAHTNGTVFALSKSGSAYQVLRSFSTADGIGAQAGLIQGQDGRLYGTLYSGGPQGGGVAYALETNGTAFTLIKAFAPNEGYGFSASLTETSDGVLYAVATFGGAKNVGGIFRFLEDGSDFRILKGFTAQAGDAYNAVAPVIAASDGKLYFTTPVGGAYAAGTLSKMSADGTGFGILKSFSRTGTAATYGRGELTGTTDGLIFGVTQNGGEAGKGTVFRVQPNGADYSIVHSFGMSANDSANPVAGVVQGQDGLLYGTARFGGAKNLGTVYRLAKDGTGYQVLHRFAGAPADGAEPQAKMIEGRDGLLYGVTVAGGALGKGILFRLGREGSAYTVLRSFRGGNTDGAAPASALFQADDGLLYGATYGGGPEDAGTLFRIGPDGSNYQVLQVFTGAPQTPANPWSGLIQGADGLLYGTSYSGGNGGGTVFRLATDGANLQILAAFPTVADGGANPVGPLVLAPDGRLWGTCYRGGNGGCGTVFRLGLDGAGLETVYAFAGAPTESANPPSGLLRLANGVFYGTTVYGGGVDFGSLFRISTPDAVRIAGLIPDPLGAVTITVEAPPGWTVRLQQAATLSSPTWSVIGSGNADNAGRIVFTDVSTVGTVLGFYRVRATPPAY